MAEPRLGILERLSQGVVLGDGGYVLELERRGHVQAGPYTPEVALEAPAALRELHSEFRRAGAEVLQALTFYGEEAKLAVQGLEHQAEAINRASVEAARQVADPVCLVAGVVTLSPSFSPGDEEARRRVRGALERQVAWLCDAGVDFLIGETFVYFEEAMLATEVLRQSGLPVMVTMNISSRGSRDQVPPAECGRRLAEAGAQIIGANCSFEPGVSLEVALAMGAATDAYLACQPVGYATGPVPFTGHPEFPLALDGCQLTRFDLARFAAEAKEAGVRYIGGCCGVVAHHVRAMAEALGRRPPASAKSPDLSRHVSAVARGWASPAMSQGTTA
ncbi:MAG: homocysteine S-methyltransferase family protein [Acidimicrobiales bacterium]|nr:homocysteine S-methyltransferase family protein [Acidimicrobiales bacterium]MBO0886974.1 homocysteine S-methyltransferase family protein [Acidimicrobiales bacterium]